MKSDDLVPESGTGKTKAEAGPKAVSDFMTVVYDELRRLARHYLRGERPGQSLQATALVNEAYLRLKREKKQPWRNRSHFLAIAATSMRQILVERARARNAAKRGGSRVRISLSEAAATTNEISVDLLALDEALTKLATLDGEHARIVELRFFAGLSIEECAETMGKSPATIKRAWNLAQAWLKRQMLEEGPHGA